MESRVYFILLLSLALIASVIGVKHDKYGYGVNGNCTFDHGFCNWYNANSGDNFDWVRIKGSTPSSSTGPQGDASPSRNGHYIYIESSHPRKKGEIATLMVGPLVGVLCMSFAYHMHGFRMGEIQIFMAERGPVGQTFLWSKSGPQGNRWIRDKVTVYGFAYDVLVVGRVGGDYTSDMAIDNIAFAPGTCYPNENAEELLLRRLGAPNNSTDGSVAGTCDFDTGLCGWSQDTFDDQFDWLIGGPTGTPTKGTGPDRHHGKSKQGKFLFTESSSPRNRQDKARIVSPKLCGQVCMRFYYHMFGESMGTLTLLRKDGINKKEDKLWYKFGNKGNQWQRGIVEVNSDQDCYKVIFEGTIGKSYYSDMAIDDIYIQKGSCCNMKSELNNLDKTGNCDFSKNSVCGWTNLKIDDFDWTIGKGKTPSPNTGPSKGYLGTNDQYAFIEASEPRVIGDTAIMTSGVLLGAMCMRFRYHMYGEEIGTLSVFRNGDGVMQQLLWQQDGNQGDFWHEAEFIIDCNVTKYQVEIEATVGGWRGDIAIDNIKFSPGSCPPKPVIIVDHNFTGPTAKPPAQVPEFKGSCNFRAGFCAWKNDIDEDFFDWQRFEGKTPTDNTGPAKDASGDGHFIFIEASNTRAGEFARLVSGSLTGKYCLKFMYHMYGDGIGDLRVETKDSENGYLWNTTWGISGSQGKFWISAAITVDGGDYVIGISAVRGGSYLGDIAIDNLDVLKGACDKDTTSVGAGERYKLENCNFDHSVRPKCNWKDEIVTTNFIWTPRSGATPSSGTGPKSDVSGRGKYLFIESSSPRRNGDKARIVTDIPTKACMTFYYNMYGPTIDTLRVLTRNKSAPQKTKIIWFKRGNQGEKWLKTQITIEGGKGKDQPNQVIIEAKRGSGYQGDIAIDEITFTRGVCH